MSPAVVMRREIRPSQLIGAGSARTLVGELRAQGSVTVLLDAVVRDRFAAVSAGPAGGDHGAIDVIEVTAPTTIDDANAVAQRWQADGPPDAVLAVGGGNVIDQAKLAVAIAERGPGFAGWLRGRARSVGFIQASQASVGGSASDTMSGVKLAAIPTTIGTGSEVNSSACFEAELAGAGAAAPDRCRVKSIASLPGVVPSLVAYDPGFTAAPWDLLRLSAFEVFARIAGAYIGNPSSLPMADRDAERLLHDVLEAIALGDRAESRAALALLSAESHHGWALRGRGPAPSPLWLVATELSMAAGVSKNAATAALMRPWLTRVLAGDARWGRPDRARAVMGAARSQLGASSLSSLVRRFTPQSSLGGPAPRAWATVLAMRVLRRFGTVSPQLRKLGVAGIEPLIAEALE